MLEQEIKEHCGYSANGCKTGATVEKESVFMPQAEPKGGLQLLQLDCDLYCIRMGECKGGMREPVNNTRQEEEEEEGSPEPSV